jgi:molybdopterin-binding protein
VQDVFRQPVDAMVAESVGVENVLQARIAGREAGLLTLAVGPVHLQAVDRGESGPLAACIHAEDIAITREPPQASSVRNRLAGHVRSVVMEGPLARVELNCGFTLVAVITAQSAGELQLQPGDAVSAIIKTTSVHLAAHE